MRAFILRALVLSIAAYRRRLLRRHQQDSDDA
jgi:hypothetical protein